MNLINEFSLKQSTNLDNEIPNHKYRTSESPNKSGGYDSSNGVISPKNEKNDGSKTKNLYQNIGTRVSKLREINETYQNKIKAQEAEMKSLDEKIKTKRYLLEVEMREHKKLKDPQWVNEKYKEMIEKDEIKMRININHVQNDPALKKIYQEKETELGSLQNKLNSLIKKTDHVKKEINTLRVENHKHKTNLNEIINKKEKQSREIDAISEEANKYLKDKGNINKELVELNEKIDEQKTLYGNKMNELDKMIDNTKKIKEFHETLAQEKFAKNSFRNTFNSTMRSIDDENKPKDKLAEEKMKLEELKSELEKRKSHTSYLNWCKIFLLLKQNELNNIIEKIKKQTGIENLDKLSRYLELSTKTNKLFEIDLKNLNEQKANLEKQIEEIKKEIQNAQCVLNDTTTKKFEYLDKLKLDLQTEEETKNKLNKKLFTLNRIIDILAKGFKDICVKLNFLDNSLNLDVETSQNVLTKCMDYLETKMIEIIQFNTDPLKLGDNGTESEELKNIALLEKVADNIYLEDPDKLIDPKKITQGSLNIKDIKENANEVVNNFMKKYEGKV